MSQLDDAIPSTEIGSTEGDDEQPSAQTGVFDSVLMELVDRAPSKSKALPEDGYVAYAKTAVKAASSYRG